jgi:hypothetical protein
VERTRRVANPGLVHGLGVLAGAGPRPRAGTAAACRWQGRVGAGRPTLAPPSSSGGTISAQGSARGRRGRRRYLGVGSSDAWGRRPRPARSTTCRAGRRRPPRSSSTSSSRKRETMRRPVQDLDVVVGQLGQPRPWRARADSTGRRRVRMRTAGRQLAGADERRTRATASAGGLRRRRERRARPGPAGAVVPSGSLTVQPSPGGSAGWPPAGQAQVGGVVVGGPEAPGGLGLGRNAVVGPAELGRSKPGGAASLASRSFIVVLLLLRVNEAAVLGCRLDASGSR